MLIGARHQKKFEHTINVFSALSVFQRADFFLFDTFTIGKDHTA
jgi:hypothetical protein